MLPQAAYLGTQAATDCKPKRTAGRVFIPPWGRVSLIVTDRRAVGISVQEQLVIIVIQEKPRHYA